MTTSASRTTVTATAPPRRAGPGSRQGTRRSSAPNASSNERAARALAARRRRPARRPRDPRTEARLRQRRDRNGDLVPAGDARHRLHLPVKVPCCVRRPMSYSSARRPVLAPYAAAAQLRERLEHDLVVGLGRRLREHLGDGAVGVDDERRRAARPSRSGRSSSSPPRRRRGRRRRGPRRPAGGSSATACRRTS